MSTPTNPTPPGAAAPARLLNKQELARHLNVTPRYIDKLVSQARLPVIRLGRKCLRFDLPQVEVALAKYTVQAA